MKRRGRASAWCSRDYAVLCPLLEKKWVHLWVKCAKNDLKPIDINGAAGIIMLRIKK